MQITPGSEEDAASRVGFASRKKPAGEYPAGFGQETRNRSYSVARFVSDNRSTVNALPCQVS